MSTSSFTTPVPDWHRVWIAEHARKLAQQTFLAGVFEAPTPDPGVWEAAGCVLIHDVQFALSPVEDADTIRNAAIFGAEHFLRHFFELVHAASGQGGRA